MGGRARMIEIRVLHVLTPLVGMFEDGNQQQPQTLKPGRQPHFHLVHRSETLSLCVSPHSTIMSSSGGQKQKHSTPHVPSRAGDSCDRSRPGKKPPGAQASPAGPAPRVPSSQVANVEGQPGVGSKLRVNHDFDPRLGDLLARHQAASRDHEEKESGGSQATLTKRESAGHLPRSLPALRLDLLIYLCFISVPAHAPPRRCPRRSRPRG